MNYIDKNNEFNVNYDLPHNEFIIEGYNNFTPSVYGNLYVKKIIYDLEHFWEIVPTNKNKGDCKYFDKKLNKDVYIEVKHTFIKPNDKCGFTNLRFYQNFDYYLLCTIDKVTDKISFYLVKKSDLENNGFIKFSTKKNQSMLLNEKIEYSFSLHKDDLDWILSKLNVLKNTDYSSMIEYFNNINEPEELIPITNPSDITQQSTKAPKTEFKFEVKHIPTNQVYVVCEKINKYTVIKLVNLLGPKVVYDTVSTKTTKWIGYGKTQFRNHHTNEKNIFINPKIGIRDIIPIVNKLNQKQSNFINVKLINSINNEQLV
jgi:hypothetical protein